MQPYDVEQSIVEGRQELNQLFDTISRNALSMDSYEAESFIFSEIMKVGHAAMKVYFASVGTGDVGKNMQTSDGSLYS
ncbi:MAG: ISKra4 family transposase, partial [Candidatus Electrothrix sp. AX2]|nr:ISKra4 family transposase [Candidatus Electrothrix gigas]